MLAMMFHTYLARFKRLMDRFAKRRSESDAVLLKSEYRKLKQLHRSYNDLVFANSRMLPTCRTSLGNELLSKEYWSHVRTGTNFDCCIVHRARKQLLLEQICETERKKQIKNYSGANRMITQFHESAKSHLRLVRTEPDISPSILTGQSNVSSAHTAPTPLGAQSYLAARDGLDGQSFAARSHADIDADEYDFEDLGFADASTDDDLQPTAGYPMWLVHGKEFGPSDAAYLRYRLHVTAQKLNSMLKRAG